MRQIAGLGVLLMVCFTSLAQVDTTYVYNNSTPYGSLDIRLAKSASDFYFLEEGKTFSFREENGVRTGTYLDMTSWDSSPFGQGNMKQRTPSGDLFVMNYRLMQPQNYQASYDPGYPLIVMLHGLGESGNCWERICHFANKSWSPNVNNPAAPTTSDSKLLNNDHNLMNGGYAHMKAVENAGGRLPGDATLTPKMFPGFVLFPQNLNGWDVGPIQDMIRLVRLIAKKYNIDENRIYIHGLSNGGQGVYEAIKRAPWLFASAITMSAVSDANIINQKLVPTVAHIPLWTFQGGKDIRPLPSKTENYVKQFRDGGMIVRYTKYDHVGHGTWGLAYSEPEFFTWMLGKSKATLHSFAGSSTICSSDGLKLEVAPGFRAYQWEFNGQLIADATGNVYMAKQAGKYRVRFSRVSNPSESQWNQWSNEIEVSAGQPIPQPAVKQYGTTLLNDLNNYPNARLEAQGNFGHYYWYKNGTRVDFPGDQDDTVKYAIITPAMGKGIYTVVTSNFDNCQSPPSEGKSVIFGNQAPITINAPTNFVGTPNAASEITLTWEDASSDETGFEIWRRRRIDGSTFSPWEMATLTAADAKTFSDKGLYPSSLYHYKIRAVSSTARSNYTPSAATEYLTLETGPDTQAPSAPENFMVKNAGIRTVRLTWSPSTDNTVLRNYVIYYGADSVATTNLDTTFVLRDLPLNQVMQLTVRAVDVSGNYSAKSNSQKASTYYAGLYYEHSTAATLTLDSINWASPEFTGYVQTFTLAPKTQSDYFNFRFDGYIFIATDGNYEFRTSSDDGSRLKINDATLVENDGRHTFKTVASSPVTLAGGAHRITVEFFDYIESDSLLVEYKGPDTQNQWTPVTVDVLKSAENVVTAIEDPSPTDGFTVDVYPNPSSQDNINVRIQTVIDADVSLELIDPMGRRVFSGVVAREALNEPVKISVNGILRPGLYIVSAHQGKMRVTRKLIIRQY